MSAGSGILPNAATLALVDELRKNSTKLVFALFRVEGVEVVPDVQFPSTPDEQAKVAGFKSGGDEAYAKGFETNVWPLFVKAMENAVGPRFAVIDFAFTNAEGRIIRQLVSVSWCPDKGTPARVKMTFASTKTAFENRINVGKKYGANDFADLEYKTVYENITQK
jgi:hypothetical protein